MNFIIFSVSSAFFFALTFFFRKLAGKTLPLNLAYFVETCMQMLIMLIVFIILSPELRKGLDFKNKGLPFAILAGITVVTGVLLNYLALKTGVLSKVVSITSPAQIIFGVLIGVLITS